jgi:hypothetical protein
MTTTSPFPIFSRRAPPQPPSVRVRVPPGHGDSISAGGVLYGVVKEPGGDRHVFVPADVVADVESHFAVPATEPAKENIGDMVREIAVKDREIAEVKATWQEFDGAQRAAGEKLGVDNAADAAAEAELQDIRRQLKAFVGDFIAGLRPRRDVEATETRLAKGQATAQATRQAQARARELASMAETELLDRKRPLEARNIQLQAERGHLVRRAVRVSGEQLAREYHIAAEHLAAKFALLAAHAAIEAELARRAGAAPWRPGIGADNFLRAPFQVPSDTMPLGALQFTLDATRARDRAVQHLAALGINL